MSYGLYCYYGKDLPFGAFFFDEPLETLALLNVGNHLWTIKIEMAFYFNMLPLFAVLGREFLTIDYKCLKDSKFKSFWVFLAWLTGLTIFELVELGFLDHYMIGTKIYWLNPLFSGQVAWVVLQATTYVLITLSSIPNLKK